MVRLPPLLRRAPIVAVALIALCSVALSFFLLGKRGDGVDVTAAMSGDFAAMEEAMVDELRIIEAAIRSGRTSEALGQDYAEANRRFEDAVANANRRMNAPPELVNAVASYEAWDDELQEFAGALAARVDSDGQLEGNLNGFQKDFDDLDEAMGGAAAAVQSLISTRLADEAGAMRAIGVGIVIGLGLTSLFSVAFLVTRSDARRARDRELERSSSRAKIQLGTALQLAESEREIAGVLDRYLTGRVPGSRTQLVRIAEDATLHVARVEDGPAPEGSIEGELEGARSEDCLAVRLGQSVHNGDPTSDESLLRCEICGDVPGSCVPLSVRGQSLGALHVTYSSPAGPAETEQVEIAARDSAPVIANLHNLAIAERRAATDWLTELPNRRSFEASGERMLAQARRFEHELSIVLLDLDRFKAVNDDFGHDAGDEVLRTVAQVITASLRGADLGARIGGEEFALVLPETDGDGAAVAAERLRGKLEEARYRGVPHPVTASFGVASFPGDGLDFVTLMGSADTALYAAKDAGRNAVRRAGPDGSLAPID